MLRQAFWCIVAVGAAVSIVCGLTFDARLAGVAMGLGFILYVSFVLLRRKHTLQRPHNSAATPPRRSILKRPWIWIPLATLLVVIAVVSRPVYHLVRTAIADRDEIAALPADTADDASRLNETHVAGIWNMPADAAEAEPRLRELLLQAHQQGLHVSIAGARHSMGGQTIFPDGVEINMLPYCDMKLDEEHDLLHVQAGARWVDVVAYLNQYNRSVAVMQSNNAFSVGGSLSVNCHGWQNEHPPIASTVESLRVMTADGEIHRCSRSENAELFSLVLGGYGLFGVILDADLHVVPNETYRLRQFVVPTQDFLATWEQQAGDSPRVAMAFGRLSIVPDNFLREAILYVFDRDSAAASPAAINEPALAELARVLFRGSVDSDYGKKLRWAAERNLLGTIGPQVLARNQLLTQPVEVFANTSAESTDILHEYFVPREQFADFVEQLRQIIPRHQGNLLNVTVRGVRADPDTLLRYADGDMLALVMLFNQRRTAAGEQQMESLTHDLIDAALACNGRYYLPYRLHATPEQFQRAYPQAKKFFELKRRHDPDELFQNQLYVRYGRG